MSRQGDGLHATWTLREGQTSGVVLESMGGQPRRLPPGELIGLFDDTSRFWRRGLSRSTYAGRWRDVVSRSAMTLKLMTYAPADAPVAAAMAGLLEQSGGERNWDYRYTWIRDASFSIYALLGLGYTQEAAAFGSRLLDRVTERGRPADLTRWMGERDEVYNEIMKRGWNPKIGAFIQHCGTEVVDSSLLQMPLTGFVAPRDRKWLSTLGAMDRELVSDSLVYRYNPSASPDGLQGREGTFSLCTFWYVDALARAGRLEDAAITFEKMHTYADHLGLYSEEIGLTGEQLGNFP